MFVLPETFGAQQPSLVGVGGVGAAERPHLQAQQDLGGKTQTRQTLTVFPSLTPKFLHIFSKTQSDQ